VIAGNDGPDFICPGPCGRCGDITQNYGLCNACLGRDAVELDAEKVRAQRIKVMTEWLAETVMRAA